MVPVPQVKDLEVVPLVVYPVRPLVVEVVPLKLDTMVCMIVTPQEPETHLKVEMDYHTLSTELQHITQVVVEHMNQPVHQTKHPVD
jgi:hypothetical protein